MLNTYIKNRGTTQTLINNNNQKLFNQINWDADYDGQTANISVTTDSDGNKNHFDLKLDNEDLVNILNIPTINIPIDKRIQMDFNESIFRNEGEKLRIEMPNIKTPCINKRRPMYNNKYNSETYNKRDDETIEELIQSIKPTNYLSSPMYYEELIVPISINDKTRQDYTLTPHKRHKNPKTHKTYKVYKKNKSSSLKKSKSRTASQKKYRFR